MIRLSSWREQGEKAETFNGRAPHADDPGGDRGREVTDERRRGDGQAAPFRVARHGPGREERV